MSAVEHSMKSRASESPAGEAVAKEHDRENQRRHVQRDLLEPTNKCNWGLLMTTKCCGGGGF